MFGWLAGWKLIAVVAIACLVTGFTAGWKVKGWQVDSEQKVETAKVMHADAQSQADAAASDKKIDVATDQVERAAIGRKKEIENALPPTPKPVRKPAQRPVVQALPSSPPAAAEVKPVAGTPDRPGDASYVPNLDQGDLPVCADPAVSLPVGIVGVLNRALDPAAPDPAGWSDEEKRAPSDVGLRELSLKLDEVATQYHDLAIRHDALVDWVESEMKKRQESRE